MRIVDSRRLTGPSLLLDRPGAILDVALDGADAAAAEAAWRLELHRLLHAVGWTGVETAGIATRVHAQGMSLAFTAPIDTLYAATDVNEAAWNTAAAMLGFGEAPEPFETVVARLVETIAAERKPWLIDLAARAGERGVMLLADDKRVSLGLGTGSRSWPIEESAVVLDRIPWDALHDIPVALVTGTNGKTTSVRLLGAIAGAAGRVAGVTSTDCVTVGAEVVERGDFSGPNGARTVLRDRRVGLGVLEVARGGILRRGLPVPHAQAALVTNVANDHLGEFGIFDLATLADVKLVTAKALGTGGRIVLNADDPLLLERGQRLAVPVTWFTLDPRHPRVLEHVERGGDACIAEGEALVFARGHERRTIARIADVPITFDGTARHNVANALGAIGLAAALGFADDAIRRGLTEFDNSPALNPGRANVWRLNGVTAIVDYAHNPHGLAALVAMTAALPARRRALVIGQAGDRDDDSIREFARTAWELRPDRVFVKEMDSFLRGRERGVVPELIESELRALGAPRTALSRHDTELGAIREALAWAREGDLVLLTTHAQRDEVIALLDRLSSAAWQPGAPLGL